MKCLTQKIKPKLNLLGEPIMQDGRILKEVKLSDGYKWLSLRQIFGRIDHLSRAFYSLGIKPQEKVIIYADTRMEWFLSALTLLHLNAIMVTLFSNLGMIRLTGSHTVHKLIASIIFAFRKRRLNSWNVTDKC